MSALVITQFRAVTTAPTRHLDEAMAQFRGDLEIEERVIGRRVLVQPQSQCRSVFRRWGGWSETCRPVPVSVQRTRVAGH